MKTFSRKLIIGLLSLAVFLVCYVWVFNWKHMELSPRQKILRSFYPLFTGIQQWTSGGHARIHKSPGRINPPEDLFDLEVRMIDGATVPLSTFRGKKLLIVNTASDCGYTAQYDGLQALAERYKDRLVVIGFPANDFKEQEKSDDASIAHFCKKNFGVSFPLAAKTSVVKGQAQHPVFQWLSDAHKNGWNNRAPVWNFSKYLIGEDGSLEAVFGPAVDPEGKAVAEFLYK